MKFLLKYIAKPRLNCIDVFSIVLFVGLWTSGAPVLAGILLGVLLLLSAFAETWAETLGG